MLSALQSHGVSIATDCTTKSWPFFAFIHH